MNNEEINEGSFEVKKECENNTETIINDNNITLISDSVFDTIPFMAKLLSNLRCSFYNEEEEVFIGNIELSTMRELFDRLDQYEICANRMECAPDGSFSLVIDSSQITAANDDKTPENEESDSMRLLPWIAAALCAQGVSLLVSPADIRVSNLIVPTLSTIMQQLKRVKVRPAKIIAEKNSFFTLVFTEISLPRECRPYSTNIITNNTNLSNNNNNRNKNIIRARSRVLPTHLRDYVVEKEEETSLSMQPFESLSTLLPNSLDDNITFGSPRVSEDFRYFGKRPPGRPRTKPLVPVGFPKRPRGRPRRSEGAMNSGLMQPPTASHFNSFINIQPRGFNTEDFMNCFEKFLESDLMRKNQQ